MRQLLLWLTGLLQLRRGQLLRWLTGVWHSVLLRWNRNWQQYDELLPRAACTRLSCMDGRQYVAYDYGEGPDIDAERAELQGLGMVLVDL